MHATDFETPTGRHAAADRSPAALQEVDACEAAFDFFRAYSRERPEVVAMWAFGIGFVLAWKLKPW
jgi:hypothetical protein